MRGEYDFSNSEKNPYIKKLQKIAEHPLVDILAKLIKKFKSSKGYWYISRIVILFTIREALAWKWGSVIEAYAQKQLEGTDYGWWWTAVEFVFGIGGSWEFALGGLIVFIILSLVKVSEGENNTISLKESFLSLLLLLTLVGMGIYAISSNNTNHDITHNELAEIKALIKLQGGDETLFLEKYFGKDYAIILKHPQTYHNFTSLLKKTNKTADELLKEREGLLKKIKSQSFSPKLQAKINKAFKELRYEDTRKILDIFLAANSAKEKELIKAHYIKALTYMEQVRYLEAKEEFEKIAPNIMNVDILHDYGKMYCMLGEYDNAIEYNKKSLNIKLTTLAANDPSIATSYNNIGLALNNKGEHDRAMDYYKKSLNIKLTTLAANDPSIATSYNNIGSILNDKGEYDKAMEYYKKALKINLSTLGTNNLSIAINYNNIGLVWNSKGDYEKAMEYYNKALKINLVLLGANHPSIATSYNNIGGVWWSKGEYDKAIECYDKALKILLAIFGEKYPKIAGTYNNIGCALHSKGENVKAIEYYEKALNILRSLFPYGHPYIDKTISSLKRVEESLKNEN